MRPSIHESFDREPVTEGSSDRSFGLVFTTFFGLLGVWPRLMHTRPPRLWAMCLSAAFLVLALMAPRVLGPLNRVWTLLGKLLARITNPVFTGVMFYVIFTPAGLLLRLLGKDLLRLRYDRSAATYWIRRDPAGLLPDSMRNQF